MYQNERESGLDEHVYCTTYTSYFKFNSMGMIIRVSQLFVIGMKLIQRWQDKLSHVQVTWKIIKSILHQVMLW